MPPNFLGESTQRETVIAQNEKRKGQLNLMLFETRGKLADHDAGVSQLDDEVSLRRGHGTRSRH